MEAELTVLAALALLVGYSYARNKQHNELADAYNFAHELTHDTDRGYYPDKYEGLEPSDCDRIADRFEEAEQKWWMFGGRKNAARMERRAAEWAAHVLSEKRGLL